MGAVLLAVLLYYAWGAGVLGSDQVIFFAVLLPSIILHEVSHGAAALLFGDRTAQRAGRLTLNPLAHIDPFWTVLVPAIMVLTTGRAFGMAKPVPVNPGAMRSPRNHGLLTSLAGPATNILLAFVAGVAFRVIRPAEDTTLWNVLLTIGLANVILAAFNLIPIPPLDGSSIPERLLPRRWLVSYLRIRQYSFFVFIGLFLVGGDLLGRVLDPAVNLWIRLLTA